MHSPSRKLSTASNRVSGWNDSNLADDDSCVVDFNDSTRSKLAPTMAPRQKASALLLSPPSWKIPHLTVESIGLFRRELSFKERLTYLINIAASTCSCHWYVSSVGSNVAGEEIYDRMIGEWTTMGIISSLMMSFAYGAFFSPIENRYDLKFSGMDAATVIGIMNFYSICLFMMSIGCAILLSMGIMTLPKEGSALFVIEFKYLVSLPEIFLALGAFLFVVATFMSGITLYGHQFQLYCLPVVLVLAVICVVVCWMIILMLDRSGGIWECARKLRDE